MRSILERPHTHFEWSFTLEFRMIWEPRIFCLYHICIINWTAVLSSYHMILKTGQSSIQRALINLQTANTFQIHIICTDLNRLSICVSWYYQVAQNCFISFSFCFISFWQVTHLSNLKDLTYCPKISISILQPHNIWKPRWDAEIFWSTLAQTWTHNLCASFCSKVFALFVHSLIDALQFLHWFGVELYSCYLCCVFFCCIKGEPKV